MTRKQLRKLSLRVVLPALFGIFLVIVGLPKVFVNAGLIARLRGDELHARAWLGQAVSWMPDDIALLSLYVDTLSRQGRYAEAVPVLRRYLEGSPDDPQGIMLLLESAARSGDLQAAMYAFAKVDRFDNLSPEAAAVLAGLAIKPNNGLTQMQSEALVAKALHWPLDPGLLHSPQDAQSRSASELGSASVQDALRWRKASVVCAHESSSHVDPAAESTFATFAEDPSQPVLGPNLVTNGGFEDVDHVTAAPANWNVLAWNTPPVFAGTGYVLGVDDDAYEGSKSLRIQMVMQRQPADGEEPSRVGVTSPLITLEPGSSYLMSFVYKTKEDILRTHLLHQKRIMPQEIWLPKTGEEWQRVEIKVTNNTTKAARVQPLIRIWGDGIAHVDDFGMWLLDDQKVKRLDSPEWTVKPASMSPHKVTNRDPQISCIAAAMLQP